MTVETARAAPFGPRIITVANQKGGVGKTTTAINLGTALAAAGRSVVIVDLDPQGNASTGLGIAANQRRPSSYDVLLGECFVEAATRPTFVPRLSIVPSGIDLSGAEIELAGLDGRERFLQNALRPLPLGLDYVLIDCPPALGLLTLNALVAADAVLVPLQCEFFALEGVTLLMRTVEKIRKSFNPRLEIQGIVLTMFDKRNRLSCMVANDVRSHFGRKVYQTVIPRNVRISEAPSHGRPVLVYDTECTGSRAYIHLAGELLRQEQELVT
jgi:chromosome partitioning protein